MAYTYKEWMHDGSESSGIPFWAVSLVGYASGPTMFYYGDGRINTPKGDVVFEGDLDSIYTRLSNLESGDNYSGSYDSTGWMKLPNGFVLQWGVGNGAGVRNFPITFPNSAFQVLAGNIDTQGEFVDNAYAYLIDNDSFYIATKMSNADRSSSYGTNWLAWGN